MKNIYLLFLLISAILYNGHTEELQDPFVSKLKSIAEENLIRLSWTDSTETVKKYLVYRYTSVINNDNFDNTELIGETIAGSEYFIDYPSTTDNYFYAVLGSDSSDNTYNLFIPYRNITSVPVHVGSLASPQELAAVISEIKTMATENTIELSFKSSRINRELIIYRSNEPIDKYNDLLKASLITTISSSYEYYTDHPMPGIPYYYAVMDSELTKSGRYIFQSGQNTTESSIQVKSGISSAVVESRETLRNQPLPYLDLKSSIASGQLLSQDSSELPVKYNLTYESTTVVNNILKNIYIVGNERIEPVILADDINISENSEEYQLKRIIESDFKDGNWVVAYELITSFLSVHHSKHIKLRAHFYRGQILFFQGKYRESFMEFILAEEQLPTEIKPWQDELLILLRKEQ